MKMKMYFFSKKQSLDHIDISPASGAN